MVEQVLQHSDRACTLPLDARATMCCRLGIVGENARRKAASERSDQWQRAGAAKANGAGVGRPKRNGAGADRPEANGPRANGPEANAAGAGRSDANGARLGRLKANAAEAANTEASVVAVVREGRAARAARAARLASRQGRAAAAVSARGGTADGLNAVGPQPRAAGPASQPDQNKVGHGPARASRRCCPPPGLAARLIDAPGYSRRNDWSIFPRD